MELDPYSCTIGCKDAHLLVDGDDLSVSKDMSTVKGLGRFEDLLAHLAPPLVPFEGYLGHSLLLLASLLVFLVL